MRKHLPLPLTKGIKRAVGSRAGATQSEAQKVALPTRVKVVDRDTVLEVLSQLRDLIESYAEEVNDRAVTPPPQPRSRRLTDAEQAQLEEEWLERDESEEE